METFDVHIDRCTTSLWYGNYIGITLTVRDQSFGVFGFPSYEVISTEENAQNCKWVAEIIEGSNYPVGQPILLYIAKCDATIIRDNEGSLPKLLSMDEYI